VESEQINSLSEVREALSRSEPHGEPHLSQEVILAVARRVAAGGTEVRELLELVFPTGVPITAEFYKRLHFVERRLGFSDETSTLAGELAVRALETVSEADRRSILRCVSAAENLDFFSSLRALPVVVERIVLPAEFVVPWFVDLHSKVRNDLAQGPYWRSLEVWSLKHASAALNGLRLLLNDKLDDDKTSLGACLLGHLRVAWEKSAPSVEDSALEVAISQHGDVQKRLIYHRSWINTGWHRGLSGEEFASCLERMSGGVEEERLEGFNFLRCLLPTTKIEASSLAVGLEWLRVNSSSSLPDHSKHCVANIVKSLAYSSTRDADFLERLWPLLVAVQPIPTKTSGTWEEVEHLLVELLQKNRPQFRKLMLLLLDANPDGLRDRFKSARSFEYLLSEMAGHGESEFFSTIRDHRRFAFTLFDKLPFSEFPAGMLDAKKDDEIALALLEFRLHHLQPQHTFMFLSNLLVRVEGASQEVAALFSDELLYESKNLPGAVLGGLKTLAETSELARSVVTEAELYFEKAGKAHRTAINSMEIPGLQRALSIRARRQGREMETKTAEMSVFAQMFRTSYLIYGGNGYRCFRDGALGELSELKKFSTQIEFPRLEMIDPEGAAIRRHHAIRSIQRLEAALIAREVADDA